eukprot:9705285-Alexandrium_andersonii.AAC.1
MRGGPRRFSADLISKIGRSRRGCLELARRASVLSSLFSGRAQIANPQFHLQNYPVRCGGVAGGGARGD